MAFYEGLEDLMSEPSLPFGDEAEIISIIETPLTLGHVGAYAKRMTRHPIKTAKELINMIRERGFTYNDSEEVNSITHGRITRATFDNGESTMSVKYKM